MRYMMLIYSKENLDGASAEPPERNYDGHWALIKEAARAGVFIAAEPLAPTRSATTIRLEHGKTVIIDGPFAETKEQLAGYYILNCQNLDQAIEWAEKISTACNRAESVEIRPLPGMPEPSESGSLG
jgi:hypothetical protein